MWRNNEWGKLPVNYDHPISSFSTLKSTWTPPPEGTLMKSTVYSDPSQNMSTLQDTWFVQIYCLNLIYIYILLFISFLYTIIFLIGLC
jgi:hypothetical protein